MWWNSSCNISRAMRILNNHIAGFGRLFVVLFLLTNSGFTVVLHHCTMTDQTCGMPCCAGTQDCPGGSCEDMDGPQPPPAHIVIVEQPCMTATVVGGYETEPTVVEKVADGRQNTATNVLPPSVLESAVDDRIDLPPFHSATASPKVSPSSVETYVLNSTFLI